MLKTFIYVLTLLTMLGFSSASQSNPVYKCLDGAGKTAYQSQPCPESARSVELDIKGVTAMPILTGDVTLAQARQAIISSCMGNVAKQSNAALRKIAAEQPMKFQNFCECVANTSLSDVSKVRELIAKNNQAGFEQLGMKAGLSCAPKLK